MRLYDLALTVPWACTTEALEAILSIAAREPLDAAEIARRMHGPTALAMQPGTRRDDSARMTMRDGVAIIPIDGPIYRYADMFTDVSGGVTTDALARDFRRALDDPQVSSILFTIDSPGGEATGINELSDAIYAARGQKRIVAYIEGFGASAAYHIASAADEIVVDDDAIVGSIGTVMGVPDPAKRVSRTIDFVSSQSPKKRPDPTTESGRMYLQQLVDDMTEVFISKVMRNRALSRAAVLAVEGGMVVGQQAIDAGLADRLGSEEQLIRELSARGAGRPAGSLYRTTEGTMDWKAFWSGMFGAAGESEGQPLTALIEQTATLQAVDDPRIVDLQARLAAMQDAQTQTAAAAFADGLIAEYKALPAERQALIDAYQRAARADAALPDAGMVAALIASHASRQPHRLTEERIPAGQLAALFTGQGSEGDLAAQGRAQGAAYAKRVNKGDK